MTEKEYQEARAKGAEEKRQRMLLYQGEQDRMGRKKTREAWTGLVVILILILGTLYRLFFASGLF